tara:strand:+ start:263 stop:364 length:102 start_codon:yes stop_codon:yes gene_type:complete
VVVAELGQVMELVELAVAVLDLELAQVMLVLQI